MPPGKQVDEFWRMVEYMRNDKRPWDPVSFGFELRKEVDAHEKKSTICLKIHATLDDDGTGIGQDSLLFQSSVTLWPPTLTGEEVHHLTEAGWYDGTACLLEAHGYEGEWADSDWGRYGEFWKILKDLDAVRSETSWLKVLDFR